MKRCIRHVAVNKCSFLVAVCFTSAFLVAAVVQLPAALRLPEDQVVGRVSTLLLMPLMFGLGCYILGFVFFLVYNFLAKRFGGVEIELDDNDVA